MATEPYKLNKQIYGELSENAASIKLFTQDKIKAQEKLLASSLAVVFRKLMVSWPLLGCCVGQKWEFPSFSGSFAST